MRIPDQSEEHIDQGIVQPACHDEGFLWQAVRYFAEEKRREHLNDMERGPEERDVPGRNPRGAQPQEEERIGRVPERKEHDRGKIEPEVLPERIVSAVSA